MNYRILWHDLIRKYFTQINPQRMSDVGKLVLLSLLIVVLCGGCNNVDRYDTIITNVNLIDGTGKAMKPLVSLGIKDGKIKKIGLNEYNLEDSIINGNGKYLIPGLFDCHIHTTDYLNDFPKYIHYGVTSIFITGGSLCTDEYYTEMRKQGNQLLIPAPYVFHTSQHFSMEGRHPSKTYSECMILCRSSVS